jgi:hypothetical protein
MPRSHQYEPLSGPLSSALVLDAAEPRSASTVP